MEFRVYMWLVMGGDVIFHGAHWLHSPIGKTSGGLLFFAGILGALMPSIEASFKRKRH